MSTTNTNANEPYVSDMRSLAARTTRRLPSRDDTARALGDALAKRARPAASSARRTLRRPMMAGAGALAAAAVVLLVPVPYRHQMGWDAVLRSADGHQATVHLGGGTAADAQRRAGAIARRTGANDVRVSPRTELVWGSVYAMAKEKLFHVNVDMAGKTDAEVEAEIRAQIAQQGWAPGEVEVERGDGTSTVSVGATDGEHQIKMVEKQVGQAADHVDLQPEPIDDTREPGMTDEELRQKILGQLEARGLDAEVTVDGDKIRIRAETKEATP
jgi:hypothetical protein